MSTEPERDEAEKKKIAAYAHELWEQDPLPRADDLDRWLTAEAVLQTKGEISARPVSLPFFISFTANGLPPSHEKSALQWVAPRPQDGFTQRSLAVTERPWAGASPHDLAFLDNQMPHDGRLLTLQVTAAIAALDRIARLLDACVATDFDDMPPGNFAEPLGNGLPGWRLKPTHLAALLDPVAHPLELADFEGYLGNNSVAQDVGVNVVWVSLGSHARIIAEIRAGNWKKASRTGAPI